jgi:glucose-6-phosphate-specific signal transduction histidine kinase
LDAVITTILEQRVEEIRRTLNAHAPLAVIFLCGSTLEGIILGIACTKPREFNQSCLSPKDRSGKVKQFPDWTLNDLAIIHLTTPD